HHSSFIQHKKTTLGLQTSSMKRCLSLCLVITCLHSVAYQQSLPVPAERQLRWQQYETTAFLHFTVNTFTNKEWGDGTESPSVFNPGKLDARQWVKALKEAGFKMAIITAKHHDGFCLWPSKFTEHSVRNSPWKSGKGDVVKEVADACKEYGMKFGFYLSPWDRHEPVYGTDAYNDHYKKQLRELLTNYGPVGWVWPDAESKSVRSRQSLVNLYYQSVGRTRLLLLNVTSKREGLLEDTGVAAIKKVSAILYEAFKNNLASDHTDTKTTDRNMQT